MTSYVCIQSVTFFTLKLQVSQAQVSLTKFLITCLGIFDQNKLKILWNLIKNVQIFG